MTEPVEVRLEVTPPSPFRLPRNGGMDGVLKVRSGVVHRLLEVDGAPVVVRVAQTAPDRVLFGGRSVSPDAARTGIARMRRALGVDDDLRDFHARFRSDPWIGRAVRADPGMRVLGRPAPFEALVCAVTEQLIEFVRAAAIQRRLVMALGHRCPDTGLRAPPPPASVAGLATAQLCAWGLAERRAATLVRAAREVASGRADLDAPDPEPAWRRLRAIPGVGTWTLDVLALHGHRHLHRIPAGDLGLLKLAGRRRGGDPRTVGEEDEVRRLFEPYAPYAGLAAAYALRAAGAPSPGFAESGRGRPRVAAAGRVSSPSACWPPR